MGRMKGISKAMMALLVAVIFVGVVLFLPNQRVEAYDVNASSSAVVQVAINNKTIVDVTPEIMNWGSHDPGSIATTYQDPNAAKPLSQIQIENLGSTDITHIWLNVTQPSTNPFGSGSVNNYDPGNWLVLKRTSDSNYWFIDREEFNSTTQYIYLNTPQYTVSFGKVRDANHEYFWAINGSTSTPQWCNGTDTATLVVGQTAHNETQTGTIDLVGGDINTASITSIPGNSNWGLVNGIKVGGQTYCAAVYYDCSKLRLYRWNADAPGASGCTAFGTGQSDLTINGANTLYPGDSMIADVQLHIPYGVPDGTVPTGYMYVIASAQ